MLPRASTGKGTRYAASSRIRPTSERATMVNQHEQQPLPSSAKRTAELIEEGALATIAATKQLIV